MESWEHYFRNEELREAGKLIEKGICPECQDEKPSLIRDDKRKEWICNTCGVIISEDSPVFKYPDEQNDKRLNSEGETFNIFEGEY